MDPIIDFRIRPPLQCFRDQFIYRSHTEQRLKVDQSTLPALWRNRDESRSARERSLVLLLEEMDRAGVTHGVVLGRDAGERFGASSNDEIAEFCAGSGDRFVGFAGINGRDPKAAVDQVRRIKALGLRGAAFDNGFVELHQDDPALWPVYDAVAEEGLPLALTASMLLGSDMSFAHPDRFRTVAKRYPDTQILVPHAGWPWTTLACAVAYENPNIWLMPDCYLNTRAPGTDDFVQAANTFMEDRLLYASAYPVRPIGTSLETFRSLPLKKQAMAKALFSNAQRLLGWPVQ